MAQQIKDPALSLLWLGLLLWCRFSPWPRNFCMPSAWPRPNTTQQNKTKPQNVTKDSLHDKFAVEYSVVTASKLGPSPWPFHLGRRMLNHKKAIYEYKGKKQSRLLWADIMVKMKDFRLLVLVPKNKPKHIYAFALVNFLDVYG